MKTLIQNAILIKEDGTILKSAYRHDYTSHTTPSGVNYFIDGGIDYIRCSFPPDSADVINLNLYAEDSIDDKIDKLVIKDKDKCFLARHLSITKLKYFLKRINNKYVVELIKIIINKKENLNTNQLCALKGNEVEKTGLYIISTTGGDIWKSKLIKINKKICYFNLYKQTYLTVENSDYTFYKI